MTPWRAPNHSDFVRSTARYRARARCTAPASRVVGGFSFQLGPQHGDAVGVRHHHLRDTVAVQVGGDDRLSVAKNDGIGESGELSIVFRGARAIEGLLRHERQLDAARNDADTAYVFPWHIEV